MSSSEVPDQRVRLVEGQEVSLGCGTLILIALIVMIFAGRGNDDLQREIEGLRTEVVELRTSIASLEEAIERGQQVAPAEN